MNEKMNLVVGPTFEEMLNPAKIDPKVRKKSPCCKIKRPLGSYQPL